MDESVEAKARYYASLATKRVSSGLVCRDAAGRVLLVRPTYKPTWEVPGVAVEADESPSAAVGREVREELSISLPIGRLLVIDWLPARPGIARDSARPVTLGRPASPHAAHGSPARCHRGADSVPGRQWTQALVN